MGKHTILVVDDEPGIRELIRMFLEKEGYDVIEAENGKEAMEIVSSDQPHLILLDIEMPGMTGFEVCRNIRKKNDSTNNFFKVSKRGVGSGDMIFVEGW